ncbi:hypothetical protein C8J55DRAFT_208725 [Lentinula edodes]|uniref:Uncharacterized protein n=1 Tax=Lentinula lateritia TaxID=40482 RepID=A0A9W8ZVP2_9AGAR|nr:hypothetical protein C8J55DRAFT_208725 [Lentinula edodes]
MLFVTFLFSCVFFYFQCPASTAITLVNVTVDDQFGDPYTHSQILYTPTEAWSIAPDCDYCPDHSALSTNKAYNRTWHESYFSSSLDSGALRPGTSRYASFQFMGTAVYVICIVPPSTNITTQMNFFIDGDAVGSYPPMSATVDGWQYDVVVYRNTSLSTAGHQLLIQSGEEDGEDAIILLDSIIYTTHNTIDSSIDGVSHNNPALGPKRVPLAPVIGATVGGFVLILLCGVFCFLHQRRQKSLPVAVQTASPLWKRLLSPFNKHSRKTHMSLDTPALTRPVVPHSSSSSQNDRRIQSILAWQKNTQQGTRALDLAPPDMSEELSSYYEDATTTESRRVRTPPPPPRRYIITNK